MRVRVHGGKRVFSRNGSRVGGCVRAAHRLSRGSRASRPFREQRRRLSRLDRGVHASRQGERRRGAGDGGRRGCAQPRHGGARGDGVIAAYRPSRRGMSRAPRKPSVAAAAFVAVPSHARRGKGARHERKTFPRQQLPRSTRARLSSSLVRVAVGDGAALGAPRGAVREVLLVLRQSRFAPSAGLRLHRRCGEKCAVGTRRTSLDVSFQTDTHFARYPSESRFRLFGVPRAFSSARRVRRPLE